MKNFLSILIGLFLIVPFITAEGIRNESKQPQVTENNEVLAEDGCFITYVTGEVFFQNFEKASVDIEVLPGDELITKKGRAEIYLGNGSFLRMDRNTRIAFLAEKKVSLGIWNGSVHIRVNGKEIEVKTPHQEFLLSRGLYRIDVEKNKTSIYENPRIVDSFDSWSYDRENKLNRPVNAEINYPYGLYSYWSWRWYFLYHSWYWSPYRYYFYWHYQYYNYSYRQHYSQHRTPLGTTVRTTVRKNQLQAPRVQNRRIISKQQIQSKKTLSPQVRTPQSQPRLSAPSRMSSRFSIARTPSFSRPMSRPIQKRIVRKK